MHSKFGELNLLQAKPLSFENQRAMLFQPGAIFAGNSIPDVAATGTDVTSGKGFYVYMVPATIKSPSHGSDFEQGNVILADIIDCSPRWIEKGSSRQAIPLREDASLISTALGLGKSQVARFLGVSRTTLYDWIKGKIEPQGENAARLRALGRLTVEVCRDTRRPLYHRFVEAPLEGESESILDLLLREQWDEAELARLLHRARYLTTERDKRIGSTSRQEDILIDNLTGV